MNGLCECCQKHSKTKEYIFTNGEIRWTKPWCRKCKNNWMKKCKSSPPGVVQVRIIGIDQGSWLERLIEKFIKRGAK